MGSLWDRLKGLVGAGSSQDSRKEEVKSCFEDRVINADKHQFKSDKPEPPIEEKQSP